MGIFEKFLKKSVYGSTSKQTLKQNYTPQKFYTPEELVIYEQEQSGQCWHGVPISELSKLAQTTNRGKYVEVDKYGFLVFHYTSKSRKTHLSIQCELDNDGFLQAMPHSYYPGQWRDSSDEFIELVNQHFVFQ